ncbi:hypothetical protein BDZ88DRAFT_169394 [Geranomyces variabilis]|nr:hypothetical protein BDZ88DRAFT_169394 [Geranomyces variabilis]
MTFLAWSFSSLRFSRVLHPAHCLLRVHIQGARFLLIFRAVPFLSLPFLFPLRPSLLPLFVMRLAAQAISCPCPILAYLYRTTAATTSALCTHLPVKFD